MGPYNFRAEPRHSNALRGHTDVVVGQRTATDGGAAEGVGIVGRGVAGPASGTGTDSGSGSRNGTAASVITSVRR